MFSPAISGKSATVIRHEIRRMRLHLHSDLSFKEVATMINAKAGGWAAYFGRFRPSETARVLSHIDRYLVRWDRRKYKHLRRAPARAYRALAGIKKSHPGTLPTGDGKRSTALLRQELDDGSRISREVYVRICGSRRVKLPPATRQHGDSR
jgi:hypothetical protein